MSKRIKPSVRNRLLANIIPWLSDEDPGWRLNFNKLVNGLLLALVVGAWNITSASLSGIAALIFLGFLGLAGVVCYVNIDRRKNGKEFSEAWVAGMIAVGIIACVVFYVGSASLHEIWSAILMFAFIVCLAAVSTTQWYPAHRDSWNYDEIVAESGSKSSDKEKART